MAAKQVIYKMDIDSRVKDSFVELQETGMSKLAFKAGNKTLAGDICSESHIIIALLNMFL